MNNLRNTMTQHGCYECGFYHDCPENYECPPLEALNRLRARDGIIIVIDGNFVRLSEREEDEILCNNQP